MLIDDHATLNTLQAEANYYISNLAPTDLFIFYYAGHGCQIEGTNRLTAYDSNSLALGDTTIDLEDDVIAKIKASACTRALLFIDACAENMKALALTRSLIFDLSDDEIEEKLDGNDYLAVYLSCSDGEKSHSSDAIAHGVFTWHLLKALRGEEPRALEKNRWMTDTSLRDWLETTVSSYVTKEMTVRSTQTPRAVLHSPHTFRIRHVPEPPVPPATALADLGLQNVDAFLESSETGAIRSLSGFQRGHHRLPSDHNDAAADWIGRLKYDELKEELDDFFRAAKDELGFRRREGDVNLHGGDGGVDTPAFRYSVLTDQNPDDHTAWRVRRRLELRDGWEARRDEVEKAIVSLDLDRFVVTFDKRRASYDDIADALEELADRDEDGDFDEYRSEQRLIYARGDMSITFDFHLGQVEFSVSGQTNLELIDATRTVSLGWHNPSPMLAAAGPAMLPDQATNADIGTPDNDGIKRGRRR
jgi:Caspase domain